MDATNAKFMAVDGGNRDRPRDSMFLQAVLRPNGKGKPTSAITVRVRNISPGGMMVESEVAVAAQDRILVELRNIGEVNGTVAWVNGSRFGVAFDAPIDPKLARQKIKVAPEPILTRDGFRKVNHPLG